MRINWQRIVFIGLVATFVFNAGACELIRERFTNTCNPRVLATCEP